MVFGFSLEDIISSQIAHSSDTPSHITPSQCISIRQRIGFSWYRDRLSFLLFRIEIHAHLKRKLFSQSDYKMLFYD
jgi:hypothetical protein